MSQPEAGNGPANDAAHRRMVSLDAVGLLDTLDTLPQPVVLLDEHASIVWVNAAWSALQPAWEVKGEVGDSYPGAQTTAADLRGSGLGSVIAVCRGELQDFEHTLALGSEPERVFRVRAARVANISPPRILVSHGDISDEQRTSKALQVQKLQVDELRQQLVQAQKLESIGRLTGGVAHDFNNMLTSIICFTRFVVDDMAAEDPRRADLIEVLKSADNAARLTHQLLAFSRRKPVAPVQLDINDAVASVGRVLRRTLGEQIELVIEPSDEPLHVICDPGQFDQLLFNLAIHAKDAVLAGGTITFALGRAHVHDHALLIAGDYVEILVTDDGPLPSASSELVAFDALVSNPFERASGLGMVTCRAIVEQAQGIILHAPRSDAGNHVRVLLPRTEEPRRADATRRASAAAPVALRGTVLVVEDQPAILRTMVRALASTGMRVLEAGSAEDALAVLESKGRLKPELLVTDVVLPRMSGPHLVEMLRASQPNLKVLYVSGYVGDDLAHSVRTDESTAFVMKPFTGRQLAVRAAALLSEPQPR